MKKTHYYSNTETNKIHDDIVNLLADEIQKTGYQVCFPDREDNKSRQPDISVDEDVVIEVKVINPTLEDFAVEEKARKTIKEKYYAESGGTINPRPIAEQIDTAVKQLRNRSGNFSLVVLVSPLEWQLSESLLEYMLLGLETYHIKDDRVVRYTRTKVPIKKRTSIAINGIMYIYGENFNKRRLWLTKKDRHPLFEILCKKISYLFPN